MILAIYSFICFNDYSGSDDVRLNSVHLPLLLFFNSFNSTYAASIFFEIFQPRNFFLEKNLILSVLAKGRTYDVL